MAMSGSVTQKVANGYCTISVEWSAVNDYLNGTTTITADAYFDSSDVPVSIETIPAQNNQSYIEINKKKYYFSTDIIVGRKKHHIGTITSDPISLTDSTFSCPISLYFYMSWTKIFNQINTYINIASVSGSWTVQVDGIERCSVGTVYGDFTLGSSHTLSVVRKREEFSHKIEYSCGSSSELISGITTNEEVSFIPPVDLSAQNTSGTSVSITFKITTFYQNTDIGYKTVTKSFKIPESVIPSCTVNVTDATLRNNQPISDIYGGFVQGQSRFKVSVSATPSYNSPIVSYSIKANGTEYTEAEATTGVIKLSGSNDITVTVKDKRGRTSDTVIQTVNVFPYTVPVVSKIKINRCDSSGVEQPSGNDHIKVMFDAEITDINGVNSASYMLTYQKVSGLTQTDVVLSEYSGQYSVSDGSYIFEADMDSPYEITVKATDDFATGSRTTGGSSAMTIFNVLASGLGMCFGGVATVENAIENKLLTYPSGGFMFDEILSGESLISIRTPNVYKVLNGQDVANSPTDDGYTLIVLPGYDGNDVYYIAITSTPEIFVNRIADSSWGVWKKISFSS